MIQLLVIAAFYVTVLLVGAANLGWVIKSNNEGFSEHEYDPADKEHWT